MNAQPIHNRLVTRCATVLALTAGLLCPGTVGAQRLSENPPADGDQPAAPEQPVDYDAPNPKPPLSAYFVPLLSVQLVNGAYWLGSRYLLDAGWARISIESAESNVAGGFEWDDNDFKTNQFGHPYQGSSYFSAARAGGLGFWQSVPYTFYGALTWELLLEREPPAANDLITTTIAGAILGELSYRLANYVLDDSSGGVERGARESLGFGLNPVYGLGRLAGADTWTPGPPPRLRSIVVDLQLAVHNISDNRGFEGVVHEPRLALYYGDIAALEDDFNAFDYMTFEVGANIVGDEGDTFQGAEFAVAGLTNGMKFRLADHRNNAVFGVLVEFDYFENELLDLGTSGVGPALLSTHSLGNGFKLHTRTAIFAHFGGIEDPHSDLSIDRDTGRSEFHYSFGGGMNGKLWLRLVHRRRGEVFVRVRRYSYQLIAGSVGRIFAGLYGIGAQVNVYEGAHIGVEAWASDLEATYKHFPTHTNAVLGTVLYVGYRL